MSNKVLVHCKNTDQILEINEGDSLLQIYGQSGVELPYQVLCARVNNKTEDLDYRVFRPKDIEFIDASHPSGMRTYVRSLCFVFYKALELGYGSSTLYRKVISAGSTTGKKFLKRPPIA